MRVEGTIVEAGTLENKGSATCGVVVKVPQAQRIEMMRMYAREVVVIPKDDYYAREAEEERLRDVKRQRVAEGMSRWCKPQSPHLGLEAELSSALSTALAEADRVAALVEEAAAELAVWAERLADVVRVLGRIDEAAQAGKGAKE